jgi:hypothetical protein
MNNVFKTVFLAVILLLVIGGFLLASCTYNPVCVHKSVKGIDILCGIRLSHSYLLDENKNTFEDINTILYDKTQCQYTVDGTSIVGSWYCPHNDKDCIHGGTIE